MSEETFSFIVFTMPEEACNISIFTEPIEAIEIRVKFHHRAKYGIDLPLPPMRPIHVAVDYKNQVRTAAWRSVVPTLFHSFRSLSHSKFRFSLHLTLRYNKLATSKIIQSDSEFTFALCACKSVFYLFELLLKFKKLVKILKGIGSPVLDITILQELSTLFVHESCRLKPVARKEKHFNFKFT